MIRVCKDNAYENGCLPKNIRGIDKVALEQNPDLNYDPATLFSDDIIKTRNPVYILADGSYIIGAYSYLDGRPIFAIDINGFKGPNKWGYDLFNFAIRGNLAKGISSFKDYSVRFDTGGRRFIDMLQVTGLN